MNNIDLSSKHDSMTHIIESNLSSINACSSTNELATKLSEIFSENKLNTEATRRLIFSVRSRKSFSSALQTVYNSYLCGCRLSVNQK